MSKKNTPYSAIEHNAFFISVFVHLIVANLFIFSIETQDVAFKPEFVFWGSFLDSIEGALHDKEEVHPMLPVLHAAHIKNLDTPHSLLPQKPNANYQNTNTGNKNFIKNTFLEKTSKPQDQTDSRVKSLNRTKAQYAPLKIQPIIDQ